MSTKKNPSTNSTRETDLTSSASRRRLLTGTLAAGVALPFVPNRWTRPIVDTVVLPAHAQTSGPCVDDGPLTDFTAACSDLPANGVEYRVTDHIFSLCDGELVFERITFQPASNPGAPSESGILRIIEVFDADDPDVSISAYADGFIEGAIQPCSDPVDLGPQTGSSSLFVNGDEYIASATVTRSGADGTVSLINISVDPAP